MLSGKRFALSIVAAVALTFIAAAPSGAQEPPRDPQRPHSDNMELVGAKPCDQGR